MQQTQQIKIYIQPNDLQLVMEGKKPSVYWTVQPSYHQNIIEITVPLNLLTEWKTGKNLLFD